jgi:trehalose 6-phosphate phosphatase
MYLFSNKGLKFLESLSFNRCLFAFDFDGTLSKIVRNPEDATIAPLTKSMVSDLGKKRKVAVISGRGLADLKKKMSPTKAELVGNHGLEGVKGGERRNKKFHKLCLSWRRQIEKSLPENGSGIEIEDKSYSLAIHFRKSRHKKIQKEKILACVSKLKPQPRIIPGKDVVNVVPIGAPHKGMALLEIIRKNKAESAFYIGDDDTDEDIFSLPDSRIFTVRVGKKRSSSAKFYIQRQSEMNKLLKTLLRFIEKNDA